MATQTIYYIALVGHIVGFTMMAGTTFVDFIVVKQFWKQFAIDKQRGQAVSEAVSKFPVLFSAGFILLVISGVSMMYITHGAFGEQIWFRVKFGLIILILINGIGVGKRQGTRLRNLLTEDVPGENIKERLLSIRRNFSLFHISQLALFLAIFVLSVFKFN